MAGYDIVMSLPGFGVGYVSLLGYGGLSGSLLLARAENCANDIEVEVSSAFLRVATNCVHEYRDRDWG